MGLIDSTVDVTELTLKYKCNSRLAYETQADLDYLDTGFETFTNG